MIENYHLHFLKRHPETMMALYKHTAAWHRYSDYSSGYDLSHLAPLDLLSDRNQAIKAIDGKVGRGGREGKKADSPGAFACVPFNGVACVCVYTWSSHGCVPLLVVP